MNGKSLYYLSEEYQDNEEFVKLAVKNKALAFEYASPRLR